jgi:2-amino-4-hydroxy-6-hydroxymethyldihydropteridine diphosphokinase
MTGLGWVPAYIAVGSNLEQPDWQVRQAFAQLSQLPYTVAHINSSLYRSVPMGPVDQPPYINAVVGLLTQLSAEQLLEKIQGIERRMGKQISSLRWGPRVIDLDLLLYGDQRSDTEQMQLPHPGLLVRNFVMQPLAEIAPNLQLPNKMMAMACAHHLGMAGMERIA